MIKMLRLRRREYLKLLLPLITSGCLENTDGQNGNTTGNGKKEQGNIDLITSSQDTNLPTSNISIILQNTTSSEIDFNPYGWNLSKEVEGNYKPLVPMIRQSLGFVLAPNGSLSWDLTIDNRNEELTGEEIEPESEKIQLTGLGPGKYRFSIELEHQEQNIQKQTGFELNGQAIEVEPMNSVNEVRRENGEILLSTSTEPVYTVAVQELENIEENGIVELIPEQILQVRALRNTLPYLTSSELKKATLETDNVQSSEQILDAVVNKYGLDKAKERSAFDIDGGEYPFKYDGSVYRLVIG